MKLFFRYLKEKQKYILIFLLFGIVFSAFFALFHIPQAVVIFPFSMCAFLGICFIALDFLVTKSRHDDLEIIKKLPFETDIAKASELTVLEEDYKTIVTLLIEENEKAKNIADLKYRDMIDYYTVWAHQIKTPISSMKLTLQNEDSDLSRRLSAELFKIEQYVQMVMTFLRLDSDFNDYIFKEYSLDNIIRASVKKFSYEFIEKRLSLNFEPSGKTVITDEKWLEFVMEQIISNAVKYTKKGEIKIYSDAENRIVIKDSGIGITPEDLPRIFEKGYTGYNGRRDKAASGLGLYLCRRICDNLKINISIKSKIGTGTSVFLEFSKAEMSFD